MYRMQEKDAYWGYTEMKPYVGVYWDVDTFAGGPDYVVLMIAFLLSIPFDAVIDTVCLPYDLCVWEPRESYNVHVSSPPKSFKQRLLDTFGSRENSEL
jgi:uncharacterized protein YceK